MKDYFSYHGKGVLPIYSPGIPAYGQKGAPGNTGENGSSVHFSAWNLSDDVDKNERDKIRTAVEEAIAEGRSLSNNSRYVDDSSVEYKVDDIVLDVTGKFYKIDTSTRSAEDPDDPDKTEDFLTYTTLTNVSIYSQSFPVVKNFSAGCITSFQTIPDLSAEELQGKTYTELLEENAEIPVVDPTYSWRILNPNYIDASSEVHLDKKYLDDYYSKYIYGNYIKFNLSLDDADKNYRFVYYLELPNGETISLLSSSTTDTIFIDNKFFYACAGYFNHSLNLTPDNDIAYNDVMHDADSSNSYTIKRIFKELEETLTSQDDIDNAYKSITTITSDFIHKNCHAYVEILDLDINTTYRIDIDDIFFVNKTPVFNKKVESSFEYTYSRDSSINPVKIKTGWEEIEYSLALYVDNPSTNVNDAISMLDPDRVQILVSGEERGIANIPLNEMYLLYKTGNTAENTFNQFDKFRFKRNDNCGLSADRVRYDIEFMPSYLPETEVGKNGNYYATYTTDFDGIEYAPQTNIYAWQHGVHPEDYDHIDYATNRILRLYFSDLTNIVLLIKYNKIEGSGITYPDTVVYIGHPNIDLIDFRKPIENTSDPAATPEVIAGIHYMNKVVPYSYSNDNDDDTVSAGAGYAQINVNTANYASIKDANSKNFIDIGFVSRNNSPEYHVPISTGESFSSGDVSVLIYSMDDKQLTTEIVDNNVSDQLMFEGYIPAPVIKNND